MIMTKAAHQQLLQQSAGSLMNAAGTLASSLLHHPSESGGPWGVRQYDVKVPVIALCVLSTTQLPDSQGSRDSLDGSADCIRAREQSPAPQGKLVAEPATKRLQDVRRPFRA